MPFAIFQISIHDDGSQASELNSFLASHRVLTVEKRFVDVGSNSFWSFCVDYWAVGIGATKTPRSNVGRIRVDYKEQLSPEDFAIFAKLRDWRKAISQTEAVPVYAVFSNEQLAQIARTRVATKSDLAAIEGVGDAKVSKYGEQVLNLLRIT